MIFTYVVMPLSINVRPATGYISIHAEMALPVSTQTIEKMQTISGSLIGKY